MWGQNKRTTDRNDSHRGIYKILEGDSEETRVHKEQLMFWENELHRGQSSVDRGWSWSGGSDYYPDHIYKQIEYCKLVVLHHLDDCGVKINSEDT